MNTPHSPAEAPPAPSSTPTPPPAPGAGPEPAGAQGASAYVLRQKLADCESAFATAERQRDEALALVEEQRAELKRLRAALEQIKDVPAVAFSRDQLEMADRTINRMSEIASVALAPQSNESAARVSEGV